MTYIHSAITYRVDNYRKSADSHLKACHQIFDDINVCNNATNHTEALHDIYYLCGYILEGYCNYSIYKLYGWNTNFCINENGFTVSGNNQINPTDRQKYQNFISFWTATQNATRNSNNGHGFGFCYNITMCPPIRNNLGRSQSGKFVSKHNFQDNIKSYLQSRTEFNGVPYFSSVQIDPLVERLIDEWNPQVRYIFSPDIVINKDQITKLLMVCDSIKSTIYNNQI